MIWGIINKDFEQPVSQESFEKMSFFGDGITGEKTSYIDKNVAMGSIPLPHIKSTQTQPVTNSDKSVIAVFQGKIYNEKELSEQENLNYKTGNAAEIILHLYAKYGKEFVKKLNGKFAFVLADKKLNQIILGRDRFGIEPLFYTFDNKKLIFSTSLAAIANCPEIKKELNFHAIHQFLLFCYNPALYTFYKNVNKLRPGNLLIYNGNTMSIEPYWQLSFAEILNVSEEEYCENLLHIMQDAVRIRIEKSLDKGVFLSGGMDSSTVVALSSSYVNQGLNTFSFRCKGESFDESHYAKIVADFYHTSHHLAEYSAEDVESVTKFVKFMDEPFCDVGINIATYILGNSAKGLVNCVFSGDGGDEVYGGHPVYVADKTATIFDAFPSPLLKPFLWMGSQLPDSDKKKNFIVKAKRFSESFKFPKELFSHRWRIYYNSDEMKKLVHQDILAQLNTFDPYQVILRFNKEADGKDILSRSIYSDYNTIMGFYLRRMGLIKHFGIEARFPMLDYRLVEYAAKIPSKLKIKGYSDTKYIYKPNQVRKEVNDHGKQEFPKEFKRKTSSWRSKA